MKSWGLGAFVEFADAMSERILFLTKAKSPKYSEKQHDLLLFHFLPLHHGAVNATSYLEI
ncbi:MAG: hypothetical protein E7301_01435 [Butyrivibrio sp.]|nr:hypothetical protein [Butyrivibrio sp.]